MTDRELLELAAKAAGIKLRFWGGVRDVTGMPEEANVTSAPHWNPLADDGDALRLAVKLRIHISIRPDHVEARFFDGAAWCCFKERYGDNEVAATRRAIVRAAAEIGRAM